MNRARVVGHERARQDRLSVSATLAGDRDRFTRVAVHTWSVDSDKRCVWSDKQIWPNEDPIGKRVGESNKLTVIGVVGNVKNYGLLRPPVPELYAPYTLKTFWADMRWNMRLLVRSTSDDIAAAVRREVQTVDPGQPIYAVNTMNLVI